MSSDHADLQHPRLYRAARVAARSRAAEVPVVLVGRGTRVYRNVGVGMGAGLAGANRARTIPADQYSSQNNPANRWTGRTADGAPGPGGVYMTLDVDALGGELFHYTLGTTLDADVRAAAGGRGGGRPEPLTPAAVGAKLPSRRLFTFTLRDRVAVADLSPDSAGGRRFLDDVWGADVVQDAAAHAPYRTMRAAYEAPLDHSFARGVCQGLWDAGRPPAGIRVTSVRTERETTLGQSGFNLVFLGEDGRPIDVLAPEWQIDWVPSPGGGVKEVYTSLRDPAPAGTAAAAPPHAYAAPGRPGAAARRGGA